MAAPEINENNHADSPVEELDPALSFQWIDGGRIVVCRLKSSRQSVYDQWETWMYKTLDQWPAERPLCLVQDLSTSQFTITLYIGTRLRQFNESYRHLHAFTAVLYTKTIFSSTLISGIRLLRNPESHFREFFTDYDLAVRWLQAQFNKGFGVPMIADPNAGNGHSPGHRIL